MSTISNYYKYSELAFASYSNLVSGMLRPDYIDALMRGDEGMSQKQAATFADTYTIIDQYNDPSSGLSVTLFEDGAGAQTVAIRGTTPTDLLDLATDIIDIALLGTPEYQAQYSALSAKVQQWLLSGDLHSGFTVTGHSLGGFLAQALAAQFDSDVSAAYTYNAPGFSVGGSVTNIGTELLDIFGIVDATVPNDKIFNVRALEGISATAGLGQMLGSIQVVSIENQSPNLIANHYIAPLVDSLAVHDLFSQGGVFRGHNTNLKKLTAWNDFARLSVQYQYQYQ
ncbi:MAG: hypothetical protein JXQ81_06655 [Desulfuromonadales bacterium]|nr:hypothetical protein [Desulfuromonadales bacterium]MBN2792169.1 hypothetical protein [Desulfuromonadales bacterium]